MGNDRFFCPVCKSQKLMVKYEAKYIYSYALDNDAPGLKNTTEFLPFLYDRREQTEAKQYVECSGCGAQFPCFYSQGEGGFKFKVLQQVRE